MPTASLELLVAEFYQHEIPANGLDIVYATKR